MISEWCKLCDTQQQQQQKKKKKKESYTPKKKCENDDFSADLEFFNVVYIIVTNDENIITGLYVHRLSRS